MYDEKYVMMELLKGMFSYLFPLIFIIVLLHMDQIRKYLFKRKMFKEIRSIDKHEEFENVYNQTISKLDIAKIKAEGTKNLLKLTFGYLFSGISIVFGISIILAISSKALIVPIPHINENYIGNAIIWEVIFVIVAVILLLIKKSKYKNEVIKSFITSINPEMEYSNSSNKYTRLQLYKQSGFKDGTTNKTYVTDFIKYSLDYGEQVEMIDLHLQHYSYDKNGSSTSEIFEGILVKVTREKNVDNKILIERNKFFKGKNRIKSEVPGFELFFDLYAEDKNAADVMISNDIKEEILRLYQIYGIMFEISIKGNELFIRFFTGALFESKWFGTGISKRKLYREYVIFTSILEIIERINEIL